MRTFKSLLSLRTLLTLVIAVSIASGVNAQSVSQGLEEATTVVRDGFQTLINLMYAVCGVIGLVGAISVYGKWSNGDPDTRKSAANWFGALIFAGLVVLVLQGVFSL